MFHDMFMIHLHDPTCTIKNMSHPCSCIFHKFGASQNIKQVSDMRWSLSCKRSDQLEHPRSCEEHVANWRPSSVAARVERSRMLVTLNWLRDMATQMWYTIRMYATEHGFHVVVWPNYINTIVLYLIIVCTCTSGTSKRMLTKEHHQTHHKWRL